MDVKKYIYSDENIVLQMFETDEKNIEKTKDAKNMLKINLTRNNGKDYMCIHCNISFTSKKNYTEHLLHCIINEKEYNCDICKVTYCHKYNYKRHLSSIKHLNELKKINIETKKYNCSICDYETNKKSNYVIHLSCKKHIQKVKDKNNEKEPDNEQEKINNMNIETFKNEVISTLMTQLSSVLEENNKTELAEQTKMMIETQTKMIIETQSKMMDEQNKMNQIITEIANKPSITNNNNNNHTNNHQFNMNMFLNETCKDAMNMSEFIENLTVTMEDMEMTGTLGFAKGMSRIIMNNLNAIEVHKRPIHCSDAKRETLYVKNNGVWEKDTDDKKHTKELIYKVSSLNLKHLLKWRDLPRNKGYDNPDHKKNDEFTILVMEINKVKVEEIEKVVTIISKQVTIDKNKVRMSGYLN